MAVDAFDTFEYDKAPDYLPGFDRRVAEEDASRKLIEAQMKENDQQREANIKIGANNLKAIQNLAPKAAKLYAQHQQEQDKKFQAKAKYLLQMSGIGHDHFNKYYDAKTDAYNMEQAFNDAAIAEEEKANLPGANKGLHYELAKEFRSYSGMKQLRIAEIAAMRHANNIEAHWNVAQDDYKTADGRDFSDATPTEQAELFDQYVIDQGYSNIIGFNDVLVKENFADKVNQTRTSILNQASINWKKKDLEKDEAANLDGLYTAGTFSSDKLHEQLITLKDNERGRFSSDEKLGKKLALQHYMQKIEQGVVNGDIPFEMYYGLLTKEVEHSDGSKRTGMYGSFVTKQLGYDPFVRADELRVRMHEKNVEENDTFKKARGVEFSETLQERDGIISEEELLTAKEEWDNNPEVIRRGLEKQYPQSMLDAGSNTVEDKNDDELVDFLTQQIDDPVIYADRNRALLIQDPAKRDAILKRIDSEEGHGLATTEINSIRTQLGKIVKAKLGLDFGTSGDHPDVKEQVDSAMANYLSYFKDGRNQYDSPASNHKQAYDSVKAEINEGIHYVDQRNLDPTKKYANKLEGVREWRTKNPKNFLTKGLLPGTEQDFQQLEKWAANPEYGTFPDIYRVLARNYPAWETNPDGTRGARLYGYDWAAVQYKAMTGKELPPITGIVAEVKADKSGTWFNFTRYPSRKAAYQVKVIEDKTINSPENLTDGIKVIEVIK